MTDLESKTRIFAKGALFAAITLAAATARGDAAQRILRILD